jgi:heptose-I-phosphate ethanolaminephosphotransferase
MKAIYSFIYSGIVHRAAIITLITFFCPIFLLFWTSDLDKEIYAYLISATVSAVSLTYLIGFASPKVQKILLLILFILSIPGNLIVWSNFYVANQWMKVSTFWVIFSTNTGEASEYLSQFTDIINVAVAILYVVAGIVLIATMKSIRRTSFRPLINKIFFPLASIAVAMIMIFTYLVPAIPAFSLYHSFIRFVSCNNKMAKMLLLKKDVQEMQCFLRNDIPHTFVVVIGESTSAYHQSIYGYERPTTPYQDTLLNRGELLVYNNVLSPHTNTRDALEKVLSFANHDKPKEMFKLPNIVDMVNAANYTTYWINNQELISIWQSPVCYISSQSAKYLIDLKNWNDSPVAEAFRKVLADSAFNKVIFIHLAGNHFVYSKRYIKEFEKFNYGVDDCGERRSPRRGAASVVSASSTGKKHLTSEMKRTIDEYDNSILYGDYVLHQIIEATRNIGQSAFVVFFSDHGEEIYENGTFLGHNSGFYPTKYQARVPFVLWRSQKYINEVPEIVVDTACPYNNEDFIHSLGTLMRLHYHALDSTRSIFSPYFTSRPRMVGKKPFKNKL